MRYRLTALMAGWPLAAGLATLASEPSVSLQPFVVDHETRVDSSADVSFLLDAPAGRHGFVRSVSGHLAAEDAVRRGASST